MKSVPLARATEHDENKLPIPIFDSAAFAIADAIAIDDPSSDIVGGQFIDTDHLLLPNRSTVDGPGSLLDR